MSSLLTTKLKAFKAGVLLAGASAFAVLGAVVAAMLVTLLVVAPVAAQVSVSPGAVEATVPSDGQTEIVLTVSNASADSLGFALSLAPVPSPDDPSGSPGDMLFTSSEVEGIPQTLTTLPGGGVLAASDRRDFFEFTEGLDFVREFEHDVIEFFSNTLGVTYRPETDKLWWMDVVRDCDGPNCVIEHALLLEGDFDGNATGRQLTIPTIDEHECSTRIVPPNDAVYAADAGRFFWLDIANKTIWAMDTLGVVAEGYPVARTDYAGVPQPENEDGCLIIGGLDAHALSSEAGVSGEPLLETVTGYPFVHPRNRAYTVVVTDRAGRNRGAETPLFDLPTPDGFGDVFVISDVVRSRTDPSVLYLTVVTGDFGDFRDWIYAVRAAPLPPGWLHASPILFSIEEQSETNLTLTLDASGLAPGEYEGLASVRVGDGIGAVLAEVPVTLTVTEGTAGEEGPQPDGFALGAAYPNPSAGTGTVPLTLGEASDVRVVVYDVLGREVAMLHDGSLESGRHDLTVSTAALPAGVYVVRAVARSVDGTSRSFERLLTVID